MTSYRIVMDALDSRGTPMEPGQRVAYNRSGYVVEGTIDHITPAAVHIRAHADFVKGGWPTMSKVKNRNSILVLS